MNLKIKHFFIIFSILLLAIQVQADAPISYNKELASDVELRGTFFTNDNADGFYVSLIGENSIQIDSNIHYIDKTIKIKKTALDSRFKKFNETNIGIMHVSDDGIVTNYISPVIVDGEFVYITVDFSTIIINGMIGTTTTTLTGLSGNQSISVPNGSSYDLNITNNQVGASATGGSITYNGSDSIHTFTESGYFNTTGSFNVSALVVVGGGGGGGGNGHGGWKGGGGGAGGYRTNTSHNVTPQSYTITVGSGGVGGVSGSTSSGVSGGIGTNGMDSTFDIITSAGGGGGGGGAGLASVSYAKGQDGGSGGGAGGVNSAATAGIGDIPDTTPDQGNNGANNYGNTNNPGAGGGATSDAVAGTTSTVGVGAVNNITGTNVTYSTGGSTNTGNSGTSNTGNGGDGGTGLNGAGGDGGDGIVIIRYAQISSTINITASVTGDSNEQSYNTSQSREFTLTPTGTTNNIFVNTSSTYYNVTVTTYWTENTTLQTETATAGYAKQYINYTPSFNITSADLNTTFAFDFNAQGYIGTATSTLNDVSKTTTRDGQDVNASVGGLTASVPYWWNVTVPYNNVPTVGTITNQTAYLGIAESFTAPSYSDPEGLPIDTHYWQFGDGNTSSDQNPTNIYTSIDIFSANYTVTETATVSPQAVLREFTVDVEVQSPQNVTTVPYQTNVSINWDDYAYADKYSVYELEDGFPYVDTNPTVDGAKDAIYDYAHEFLIFSPNPVNPGDYETSYPVRTSLGAYFFHEAVDNDVKLGDDDLIYYFDLDNDGLTIDDPAWKITNNIVKKYLWNGGSWQVTGVSDAVGASTGGGTLYPKHELFIPIAELGANWTNESTVKVLIKREDSSLNPDVITWYPYGNINNTDTSLWQEMVLNEPDSYTWLANVTLSNYTALNLTPFTIYHGAVSAWNGTDESDYTLFGVITEDFPIYSASGYISDIDGNPITDATVFSCNGFVTEITTTNESGYWIGYNFRNNIYTICANATGYVSNSTSITVAGVNLTNVNITLIAVEEEAPSVITTIITAILGSTASGLISEGVTIGAPHAKYTLNIAGIYDLIFDFTESKLGSNKILNGIDSIFTGFEEMFTSFTLKQTGSDDDINVFWSIILLFFMVLFLSGVTDKNPKIKAKPAATIGFVGILISSIYLGLFAIVI